MADDNTKLILVLEAQSLKLQRSLVQVNKQIDRFAAQTERRFQQMSERNAKSFDDLGRRMKSSIGGLQNLLGPLIGTLGVREVIRFSDAWTEAGNKIAAAAQVSGLQARSLDDLKEGANGARQSLESYVDLYARLLRVAPGVAATELEVARATEIVSKSLKAGGASAQEQSAALIQLGQAIGSGFLQGDELRSLRENAPLLAKAIADEFGVTIGELKALGAEGKLTSDRVFKAIINGGKDIEDAFNTTQSTIGDAFQRINNEFTAYVGTAGQATGATKGLIDALNYLADHFGEIAPVVIQFAAVLAGAFAGKAIVGGIGAATIALGAFLTAMRAGTLTAVTFSAALGPIGLLAGAAAAAIALMMYAQGDAERAAKAHNEALAINQDKLGLAADASDAFRASLQRQIAVQLAAADAAMVEADAQLVAARERGRAAGILTALVAGAAQDMGFSTSEFDPEAVDAALTADAEAKVAANRQRIADLRRQLAEADATRLLPEGSGDRAGGGSPSAPGTKPTGDTQWQNALDSINKRTAALQAQTDAQAAVNPLIDDYGFAMNKAKAASDLLQAAQDANIAITPELKAQIDALASGYAEASVAAEKLAEAQDGIRASAEYARDALKDITRSWISDLLAGKSAAESFSNALSNIGNRLIDLGLDTLFGGGQTKGFGVVGKLFGFADGGLASNGRPKMFANGGVSDTAAIFGEGPMVEAAVPLPDGRRIPVDLRIPQGSGQGGVTVSVPITIDATGADAAAISRLATTVAQMKAELPATVIGAVRKARATGNLK